MPLFDVMRGFFGFPPRNERNCPEANPGFKNPIMNGDDEDDDDLFSDIYRHNRNDQFGFNIFAGDMLEMQRFFEQQFDEILKNFQSNWFSNSLQDGDMRPAGGYQYTDDNDYHGDNPRNKFLKPSYVNPPNDSRTSIEDTDIDNKVNPSSVLDLFPDKNNEKKDEQISPPYSTKIHRTFTSQSIKKRILPNGGIEEERKCIKNGLEEIRVSRQLGDMKHVVTSIKLADGTTEKREEYINMDEGQLSDFDKAWNSSIASPPRNVITDEPEYPSPTYNLFEIFRNFL